MDHGRMFLAVFLLCGAAALSVFWPLWVQQARAPVHEILGRQGFALTESEVEAVETFLEKFDD